MCHEKLDLYNYDLFQNDRERSAFRYHNVSLNVFDNMNIYSIIYYNQNTFKNTVRTYLSTNITLFQHLTVIVIKLSRHKDILPKVKKTPDIFRGRNKSLKTKPE